MLAKETKTEKSLTPPIQTEWSKLKEYQLSYTVFIHSLEQYLSVVSAFQDVPVVVQLVCHCWAVDLHTGCENHQLIPLAHLCRHTEYRAQRNYSKSKTNIDVWHQVVWECRTMKSDGKDDRQDKKWTGKWSSQRASPFLSMLIWVFKNTCSGTDHRLTLTTSKKKSTCGLLCTKNLTGCLSMTTCIKKQTQQPQFM